MLPQILPLFPSKISTFYDLFAGGCNVAVNVDAKKVVANDILEEVVNILRYFQSNQIELVLNNIEHIAKKYSLSKENKGGYLKLRGDYNKKCSGFDSEIALYTLIAHSFSNQIRFNSKKEFNMPFGKRYFNPVLKDRLIKFVNALKDIELILSSRDFRSFKDIKYDTSDIVYCDPPYLLSMATYNESGGWIERDELNLLSFLDGLNKQSVKFALSNVIESKGKSNDVLKEWSKKYNVYHLDKNYSNSNYQRKNNKQKDIEVLITNY